MTTQSIGFPAPALPQAEGGVIYLSKIKDNVQASVPQYSGVSAHDKIALTIDIDRTNVFLEEKTVSETQPEKAFEFSIPKKVFEQILASGKEAEVYYVVRFPMEMRPVVSQKALTTVKK